MVGPNLPEVIDLEVETEGDTIAGVTQILGEDRLDHLGWNFGGGDIDGDGYGDLFIGTGHATLKGGAGTGKMYVVFGTAQWPAVIDLRTHEDKLKILGYKSGSGFGMEVAGGDFNGDGFADILAGAPKTDMAAGNVFLIFGSPTLRNEKEFDLRRRLSQTTRISGYQTRQELGHALTSGDVNGDDIDDIIASAHETHKAPNGTGAGEVYVIYGRKDNSVPTPVSQPRLLPTYPNPFNAYTIIHYELNDAQEISLKIYNAKGQELRTLVTGRMDTGVHHAIWDGLNNHFQQVSSGVYFVKLEGEGFLKTGKILFLK